MRNKIILAQRHVKRALGFSDSLYQDMLNTSAIMGRQSEENEKYRVKWSYHPDDGLEVTYEKNKTIVMMVKEIR